MKFYAEKDNLIVWDKLKNKALCKFNKGVFETNDKYIIDRLIELEYKHDKVIDDGRKAEQGYEERQEVEGEQEEVLDYSAMTNAELKEILDSRGIKYSNRASKSDLLELIK